MNAEGQPLAREAAKVETVTAAGIENDVTGACGYQLCDGVEQRLSHAAIVQSSPRSNGSHRVTRLLGSSLLRLEQIDVPATRDVERMSTRTEESPLHACQRQVAVANRAQEYGRNRRLRLQI